jgi:hypothetical protein
MQNWLQQGVLGKISPGASFAPEDSQWISISNRTVLFESVLSDREQMKASSSNRDSVPVPGTLFVHSWLGEPLHPFETRR